MAIKDYKFVSPGVQIKEIDQSVLEPAPKVIGPVVIGKFLKGPAFVPTIVENKDEFRDVFGGTITGQDKVSDVWREGNALLSPSYASIAAEAHLDAAVSPLTVVRLLGEQHPDATAGYAGWKVNTPSATATDNGGTYALIVNKLSASANTDFGNSGLGGLNSSSYVAAYFYVTGTTIQLEGQALTGSSVVSGSGVWVKSRNNGEALTQEFKAIISGSSVQSIIFSLDPSSNTYIRKVFNTNPTLVNGEVVATSGLKKYWLGESFEAFISNKITSISNANGEKMAAAIVPLRALSANDPNPASFQFKTQHSKTGWIFAQHQGPSSSFGASEGEYLSGSSNKIESEVQKLFRFVSIGAGEYEQENYKILINNIQPPKNLDKYATFDVSILDMNSLDSNLSIKEEFTGLTLDKSSPNYIAKRIGDKYFKWDYNEDRLVQYNDFDNQSSIVRVEMYDEVINGKSTEGLMPFGFFGPPRPASFKVNPSGSQVDGLHIYSGSYAGRTTSTTVNDSSNLVFGYTGSNGNLTSSIVFPSFPLVTTISRDLSDTNSNYFGIQKGIKTKTAYPNDTFQNDFLRPLGKSGMYEASGSNFEYSFVFSLDDVVVSNTSKTGSWSYGSRYNGSSYTALSGNGALPVGENSLASRLGINAFCLPLHGGFDGFNVTEAEPLKNSLMTSGVTEKTSYVFNSYKIGIDSVKDAEVVNMNVLTVPGLTNTSLTQLMIDTCQARADALAVVDLTGDFKPVVENTSTYQYSKPTNVTTVIKDLKARNINSSYAAVYFPWVQMSVTKPLESAKDVWVPPSVVALGTFASSEAKSQIWFAPAGFNRGGLKEVDTRGKYSAGFKVVNTALQLTSKQRDQLYEVNINPIANFVNEGIVVFGQKTLQVIPSALDRINVRRLLIFVKKRVSIIASSILFDANVDVTWARFTTAVGDFLKEVKSGLGLVDYKVVLDKTTTTDELIDRNILYAKIYLKPARAIEYIAVDFIITKSGASFTD